MLAEQPALTSAHLFCGGGGDTDGAVRTGFKPLWGIENDPYAAAVFRRRFPETMLIEADVKSLSDDFVRSLPIPNIICGGTPCPDFSTAGHRAGLAGLRGSLFFEFLRFLQLKQPEIFLFENVEGILSSSSHPVTKYAARIIQRYETGGWGISKETCATAKSVKKFHQGSDFKRVLWEFGKVGYDCTWQLRNGHRWVPQNRPRVFVVGRHREYSMSQDRAG